MAYTLGQAAKATGKSKTTISRAIQAGKISAEKDAHGAYRITADELHRLYPMVSRNDAAQPPNVTTHDPALHSENRVLQVELDAARKEATVLGEQVVDLRGRLDASDAERRQTQAQLTKLLTDDRPGSPWWRRLFG